MGNVRRIYVEKKSAFAVKAKSLSEEFRSYLNIKDMNVRMFIRYDVENISNGIFEKACKTVFSEPPVDVIYHENIPIKNGEKFHIFSAESLPGQFDQRADSALQCVRFLKEDETPVIHTAVTYLLEGDISSEELARVKAYCINPVDSRESDTIKPETLETRYDEPNEIAILNGFNIMHENDLKHCYDSLGLAMTLADFKEIQQYFSSENRDPSMTEIKVLDTYWSDHCRHTTFSTILRNITVKDGYYSRRMRETFLSYVKDRELLSRGDDKPICLMDLALIAMRKLKFEGRLEDLEESEEINACSIVVPIEITDDEKGVTTEEWLISFKNETHNHPTEIEPFGGAATCIGGAIRDPLSGRSYVYQAMRVTGAADPTKPLSETLKGKLPQKKLVRQAAAGYSSYGNQIGLATGYVKEIYHPDYVAKRLEIGAVIGAAPRENVVRKSPEKGDVIILLGGRTGRDGCGGATGSSKAHTAESIETCGAEVQKGNAPTERKIQRLFRRAEVSKLIKKCNDFGAGGVSVAIGELADGLEIDLDKVPKKYAGLDGTELSISESQERMAVVVDKNDVRLFLDYASEENLEAVPAAVVTGHGGDAAAHRLVLLWRGKKIVDISRAFLNTNGASQETDVYVNMPDENKAPPAFKAQITENNKYQSGELKSEWLSMIADLNNCSQKGLVEMFDSSIGAGTVLMPYGGKTQLTETQVMAAKLPLLKGSTDTVTLMSYGFDPYLSSWSPFYGAIYAVTESIAKIVAAGGDYKNIHFTFQEYFRRMETPETWGEPFAALLGAYNAQIGFGLAAIGGKDSMSGSFGELNVPPTLVSFAVNVGKQEHIISPEFKKAGNLLYKFSIPKDEYKIPLYEKTKEVYENIARLIHEKRIVSAYAIGSGGLAAAISKMSFGNLLGAELSESLPIKNLFDKDYGDIVVEIAEQDENCVREIAEYVGKVTPEHEFKYGAVTISGAETLEAWKRTLEPVFPTKTNEFGGGKVASTITYTGKNSADTEKQASNSRRSLNIGFARPTVFIPVFPGTNCEYDTAKAFEKAGANVVTRVFKNLTADDIRESAEMFAKEIAGAQIMMFPGGFSAGDEPDGSAKFFATAFRNEKIREALESLLHNRDGLALGICNGFQAMIKLGLLPYGTLCGQDETSPTLTFNTLNRHVSKMVYTKVITNTSPWLKSAKAGNTYVEPVSHGEGRFVASDEWIAYLAAKGQIATVYADYNGDIYGDVEWNVNGSYLAIEGITSPDGRCFGKMAHSERMGEGVAINIYGEKDMEIFEAGVKYFL